MQPRLEELRAYSARWGADPDLVQGAGGNTSLKAGDALTVKASGMRLADAERRDIFVQVDLKAARGVADGGTLPQTTGLRPSIETSLHGIMPQPVVAHLHMVAAIAFAVREDAVAALTPRLAGLPWTFVPYSKPGVALAQSLRAQIIEQPSDIVIMGNHGIVLGGASFAEVDAMVQEVARRLKVDLVAPAEDATALAELARRHNLEPARFASAHWAATDARNLAYATFGSLYPDHLVFLGRSAGRLDADGPKASESRLHLAPGVGALLDPGLPDEAHEMAACLGAVVARIDREARLKKLSVAEEGELLNWDAERYRRELNRN